jgi:hypothetical protein
MVQQVFRRGGYGELPIPPLVTKALYSSPVKIVVIGGRPCGLRPVCAILRGEAENLSRTGCKNS